MPTGSLNVTHNFTGETGFIIMVLVKSTAPLTEITRVVYPAPHSQQTYLFENLSPVWHLIRFWRSADGVSLDEEILTLAGNARTGALYAVNRYEYVVDRGQSEPGVWADPVQNDTGIRDTRLASNVYWIEERGTGSLLTDEITDRTDAGGGFDFSDGSKQMESGGVYIATVINTIDADDDQSGVFIGEGDFILDEDQDYDSATMSGKNLIADFSTTVGTLTMPNLLLIPDGEFTLQTHGGLQRNVVIQLDAGDTVNFRKALVNKITLGEGESIRVTIRDNVMRVSDVNTNHFRLGQRIWGDFVMLNTAIANGAQLSQADYPRVVELMDAMLPGAVVSYTTWDTVQVVNGVNTYPNKGKFARDDVGGTFRFPDMRNMSIKALAATDGSIPPGRYEHNEVGPHDHNLRGSFGYGGYDGGGNTFFRIRNLTDGFDTVSKVVSDNDGTETIVNNHGLYPLICI